MEKQESKHKSACNIMHVLLLKFLIGKLTYVMLFNTYSMKQPDLYYFEVIKMTSQVLPNSVRRIRAAGEYSLLTFTRLVTSFFWLHSINQAVSQNKCFIIYWTTAAKIYIVSRNTAQIVKLKVHVLQLLMYKNHNIMSLLRNSCRVTEYFCSATKVLT